MRCSLMCTNIQWRTHIIYNTHHTLLPLPYIITRKRVHCKTIKKKKGYRNLTCSAKTTVLLALPQVPVLLPAALRSAWTAPGASLVEQCCHTSLNETASGRTARAARRGDTATPAPTPITVLEIPTATSSRPFRPSPLRPTRSSSRRKVLT